MSGGEGLEPAPQESQCGIDLAAFVRSVLVPEAGRLSRAARLGTGPARTGRLRSGKRDGAADGRSRASGDSSGRALMYPGRSHPLTRRAIASVRTGRVSAARGQKRSLLMTYAVEAGSLLRTVFALLLSPDGRSKNKQIFFPAPNDPVLPDRLWQKRFASWAPEALVAAGVRAVQIGERIASLAAAAHQDRLARQDAVVRAWLIRRAYELCGPAVARLGRLVLRRTVRH